ncbi:hypothetical protein D3C73_786740 [compost metagenome]
MFNDAVVGHAVDVETHQRLLAQAGVAAMDGDQVAVHQDAVNLVMQVGMFLHQHEQTVRAVFHQRGMFNEARREIALQRAGVAQREQFVVRAGDEVTQDVGPRRGGV